MKSYSSIIVTGSMGYDVIMNFPSRFQDHLQPDKLHMINVSFVVDRLNKQLGGTGTNIAYNLSLLKNIPIKLLASVGKDGDDLLNFIHEQKIDTTGVLKDEELYTATGKVITDLDNNQIWGFYYGACENAKSIKLADFADSSSMLVISANHPEAFRSFQRQAIEMGIDYMYDPGMTLSWNNGEDLKQGVENCKWLVGNDYEISQICNHIHSSVDDLIQKGITVITTLGNEGVKYKDTTTEEYVPSYQAKEVLDPTGAGDAWRAGYLTGVVRNLSVKQCLALGNSLASFAVEMYGTANHKPSEEQIFERAGTLTEFSLAHPADIGEVQV